MVPDLMYKLLWSLSLCINFYGPWSLYTRLGTIKVYTQGQGP
jgi:hypothetical protein